MSRRLRDRSTTPCILHGVVLLLCLQAMPVAAYAQNAPASSSSASGDDWFGVDKAKHFGASALIAGGGYGLAAPFFKESRLPPLLIGAGLGLAAGVTKELYDLSGHGHASWKDLTWDALGVGVGLALAFGIDVLIRGWHLQPPTDFTARAQAWSPQTPLRLRF